MPSVRTNFYPLDRPLVRRFRRDEYEQHSIRRCIAAAIDRETRPPKIQLDKRIDGNSDCGRGGIKGYSTVNWTRRTLDSYPRSSLSRQPILVEKNVPGR